MPRGRRRWRGGHPSGACPRHINRFLEPCLLLLLHCTESHGYELLEGLGQFGFEQNPVDSSTVYRMLRNLEEEGFVTSRWDTGGAGPARRLYQITEEGDRYLAWWVGDLRETDRVLHHFLQMYDAHMEVHG
ncbi:MAG TPA: helix-turn-helix transcriptional regulator [Anaerolineae bacterium]|nr:helix-turn-helix transcriptional regulator [Anaerolineae bacterium]